MKRYLMLLLVLNIVIFAYFQLPDTVATNVHQSLPEIHPEKVELLTDGQVQALPTVSAPLAKE